MVELQQLPETDYEFILNLLREFVEKTGSVLAQTIIDTWPVVSKKFIKVRE